MRLIGSGLLAIALLVVSGCGAAKPRFGGTTVSQSTSTPPAIQETVADTLAKAIEEERRETDVVVDSSVTESIVSGKRDFTREKNPALTNLDAARLMREISKYMSVPYQLGGENGQGLDCSAYTRQVYRSALKKELPRTSHEQFKIGAPVSFQELMFGDLLFFNTTGASASHVGIYLGDDLFAHASVTFGVTISSLENSYYKNRYEGARRIIE